MEETTAIVTEVHTPNLLKKLIPNRKVAAGATIIVAVAATAVVGKFLKDRFDVDIVPETTVNA